MSSSSSTATQLRSQSSTMILAQNCTKSNPLVRFRRSPFVRFRSIPSKFVVSSSLHTILTSGNMIAAAAAGSSSAHAAVGSAIAQVAVTAMAIASGACLSTKVDFLWPRLDEQPDSLILDGVDVTGYPIFTDAKVQKAIAFARKAHYGQLRKTGDPYLTHCIHTGKILAALVPSIGSRAINTVVAGILHDVIDDACESLHTVEEEFGEDVAKLVAGVSRLSDINQLLRRHRRMSLNQFGLGDEEDLLQAVLPFDLLLDRRKRTRFLNNLMENSKSIPALPKVVIDTSIALASLAVCEEALERELFISTSYVPGMEVTLCSRLKSLYSIYCKMKRKNIGIRQVYDARALRVVVGDKNGTLHGAAVSCCYNLLSIVHRLWTPIDGEFDDYIVNPKPSGYQSLHTAVQGPDGSPIEVQIRTQRMHEYAEYGLAAHWLYKEADESSLQDPETSSSYQSEDESTTEDNKLLKYSSLKAGHPVLRVEGSHLLAAVIVRVDNDGRELLVAVSFGLGASEAVADRRSSFQLKRWEAYACLYKKVSDQWWFAPGHGDWCTCLERYTLCRDGIYHKKFSLAF